MSLVSSCVCPGYEATFECSISHGVATTWQGTALEKCEGGNIILRHSQSGQTQNETCGTIGEVIVASISNNNDSIIHVSQLTINISQELYNKTIDCADDNTGVSSSDHRFQRIVISNGTNLITSICNI